MKNIMISILILISGLIFGQEYKYTDFLSEIKNNNIAELCTVKKLFWTFEGIKDSVDRAESIGYIGNNYQRFDIHFISVIQNPANSLEYFVYGKTKVKNNICNFQGLIEVDESKAYFDKEISKFKLGYLKGAYKFYEDPNQKDAGILNGVFKMDFYIDTNSKINYLFWGGDSFKNMQFEGNWTAYKSTKSLKCNWGDYRIPNSKELDGGAGEFIPTDSYVKNGWENFRKMTSNDTIEAKKAIAEEMIKWWIDKE